jgi:uncharacterized membrane protein YhaH (DUF805 family)
MSWQSVFFSSNGRMGQKDFWIAALILFVAGIFSNALHLLAPIAWLVVWYCWICIGSKRLHDAGRSGWLVLVPILAGFVAMCVFLVVGGIAAMTAFATGGMNSDPASWAVFWGSLGLGASAFGLAGLVNLIFLLWVGLATPTAGDNRYGPPAGSWISPATPPAAAPPAA